MRSPARAALGAVALALSLAAPPWPEARAQVFDRPADERPEMPPPGVAPPPPLLPPVSEVAPELRVSGPRFFVRGFRVVGVTAFDDAALRELLEPYTGRNITSEELAEVRDALTQLYVKNGYVNSGALIPDQDPSDGIVEIRVIEGRLAAVQVDGNDHFRPGRLRARITLGLGVPLDLETLEENLQLLQQDPRVERVHARLLPTEQPGEALLRVRVEERSPFRLELSGSNHAPVGFGGYRGRGVAAHDNLVGLGDTLELRFLGAEGLLRGGARYALPLNAYGTEVEVRGEYSSSEIVEEPFDLLEIETDYADARIGLTHPLIRTPRTQLMAGLFFEWRRADTCFDALEELIGCDPFDFLDSGSRDGETTVSALRLDAQWQHVQRNQVFAARSLLTLGLPVLGARSGGVRPDGQFVAWLAQLQWARRFEPLGIQAIVRTDVQLASEALPTLEQFPVGGHNSVRGYRENQLVRDQGVVASLELRVPVWRYESRTIVELAPFFDVGYSKNRDRSTPGPDTLASTGIGLRLFPHESIDAQLYWGYQIEDVPTSGNLQDDGVQFRVRWRPF